MTIIQTGGDEGVEGCGGVGGKGGLQAVCVWEVEVGRPGNVIDVGLKEKCAVKDDSQGLSRSLTRNVLTR